MSKTMIICYTDLDGYCASSIVKYKNGYKNTHVKISNFGRPIDYTDIENDDTIIVLGFALDSEVMKSLSRRCKEFIWIEHRASSIDKVSEELHSTQGVRNINHSTCYLTWKYFFPDKPVPRIVELISDYTLWEFKDKESLDLFYGSKTVDLRPYNNNDNKWKDLLLNSNNIVQTLVEKGSEIKNYEFKYGDISCKYMAFETKLNNYDILAINTRTSNSYLFNSIKDKSKYDALMTFEWFENIKGYRCTVYQTEKKTDVSKLANMFKGGGKPEVAAFIINDRLPEGFLKESNGGCVYENIYKDIDHYKSLISVKNYLSKNNKISLAAKSYKTRFRKHLAVFLNTTDTSTDIYTQLDLSDCDLAISFCYMNCGKWRLIIHLLNPIIDLNKLQKEIPNSKIIDNALWAYAKKDFFN